VAVAEERHFTRAAQRLGVAQSTISSAVSTLEYEFEAALFVRTSRRVELTDAGRALLPHARRTLAAADATRTAVGAVTGLLVGKVAVGTGKALPIGITDGLARFCAVNPGVDVDLRQGGSIELLEAVSEGRLDFAPLGLIGPLPEYVRDTVSVVEIQEEPMVFACSRRHRLAGRKMIRLVDIADERFADLSHEWAIRIVNDRAFTGLGRPRRVAFEMNDLDELLEIVGRGLGVALVPASVGTRGHRTRLVKLRQPAPIWKVGVAVQKGRPPSPAARALFAALVPGVEWPS
jgi:DNA-binding transcriptional LysR family regulator